MEAQRTALDQLQRSTNETNQRVTELTTNLSDTIKASIAESQSSMNQQQEALTNQLQQLQTAMIASNRQVHQTINDIREHLDSVFERSASHIAQGNNPFYPKSYPRIAKYFRESESRTLATSWKGTGKI